MPVTNSSKWNRIPEDFEENFGAEMQPVLPPFVVEEEKQREEAQVQQKEVENTESVEPIIEFDEPLKKSFTDWLHLIAGKVKNSATKFQLKV